MALTTVSLETLLHSAPYLEGLAERHADWFAASRAISPDTALQTVLHGLKRLGETAADEVEIGRELRIAKGRVALLAAVSEVEGSWTTAQSTAALSDLADFALEAGLDTLMRLAAARGQVKSATAAGSGLAIFALGKHGGRELNYSSD
ncbi:MAG: glutamine-synthetase adenylyltransferase, partial [Hyphomicrobiales bacterium]